MSKLEAFWEAVPDTATLDDFADGVTIKFEYTGSGEPVESARERIEYEYVVYSTPRFISAPIDESYELHKAISR